MTRLDATSEPSMEDILASIRKIIAEDPPGSRPAPTQSAAASFSQPTVSQQPALRAPERDRLSPFASRADDTSAASPRVSVSAPEPYLKSSPQKPIEPAFANEPFFSSTPAAPAASPYVSATSPSRIEPSFGRASAPVAEPEAVQAPAAASAEAASDSVDAQLSELLGETASVVIQPAANGSAVSAQSAVKNAAAAPLDFGDLMAARSTPHSTSAPTTPSIDATSTAPKAQDTRAGFTVSRDGFVPSTSAALPGEADPFEFDLGPSPFQTMPDAPPSSFAPAPVGNSLTARMSASALERIAAPSVSATVPDGAAFEKHSSAGNSSASEASVPASVAANPVLAADVAAPSVSATLAPSSPHVAAAPEPAGRFIPANASVEAPKVVDRDVLEVGAPQRTFGASAPIEVVRVAAESAPQEPTPSTSSSSMAVAVHHADGHMRTMEDTVAELLRPMLKTWLAENMPRIVERALRRELSEQMLLDKKDAAE